MGVVNSSNHLEQSHMLEGLQCLSALMGVVTPKMIITLQTHEIGLQCLSALMGVVTHGVRRAPVPMGTVSNAFRL